MGQALPQHTAAYLAAHATNVSGWLVGWLGWLVVGADEGLAVQRMLGWRGRLCQMSTESRALRDVDTVQTVSFALGVSGVGECA